MNMQKNFKGRIVVNGAHVEVEAETPYDLATIISNVVSSPRTTVAQVTKTREPTGEPTQKPKRKYNFGAGRQNGYYRWTPDDILTLAKLARDWGKVRAGLGIHAYKVMKEEGDVKERSKINIMITADRFHRYFYFGNKTGLSNTVLDIFKTNRLDVLSEVHTRSPEAA